MPKTDSPRVALLVETSTTWARSILDGINRHLRSGDYWQIFLEPHGSNESIRMPAGWTGDGVIADIKDAKMAKHLSEAGIPVVNLSQVSFPGYEFPTVTSDIAACQRMAADYYFGRGFENLAYLHLERNAFDAKNAADFRDHVEAAGGHYFEFGAKNRAWGVADWNLSIQMLAEWLKELPKPIGVFSWAIGREVVHACHLAGLKMPEEVSLLMLSDDAIFLEMSHIPISGITHSGEEIGRLAAQTLERMMRQKKKTPAKTQLVKPLGIKTRQSSDVMAITDPPLRSALDFIRRQVDRPIQVEDVAQHAGISRRALEQRFAKILEQSPADYIRDGHLARAKELLRETALSIPQVSEAAGFSSPEYLAQVFRAKLGMSPLRYRRHIRGA